MSIISIKNISKSFGEQKILNQLNLEIQEGEIFGLIGKNGAGKTTLMKIMLGLLKNDEGTVTILSEAVQFGHTRTNRFIGYLPDVPAFYPFMTAYEYLLLCGEIAGLSKARTKERALDYLTLVGLEKNNKRISGFSRGMKQRLGIAQALIHEPKILICDEPTSALDPVGRKEILAILQRIKKKTTVIFSTHILHDAEKICDQIAILHDGHFVLNGPVADILKEHQKALLIVELQHAKDAVVFSKAIPQAIQEGNSFKIATKDMLTSQQKILQICIDHGILLSNIHIEQSTLEDLFLEVTQ